MLSNPRLIEQYFPGSPLNEFAQREKKGRPPIFQLHYWWTRKPLSVTRSVLLGAILPADFDRTEYSDLCGITPNSSPHRAPFHLQPTPIQIQRIEDLLGNPLSMLKCCDPFAGGGSIPFEFLRYSCLPTINDYNPVAWLILKATLEYPPQIDESFLAQFQQIFRSIYLQLEDEFQSLYPVKDGNIVGAYLYTWQVECPNCQRKTPLISNWNLCTKPHSECSLNVITDSTSYSFQIQAQKTSSQPSCTNAVGTCIHCLKKITNHEILAQFHGTIEERLMTVITIKKSPGKGYLLPTSIDFDAQSKAVTLLNRYLPEFLSSDLIPTESMSLHTVRPAKYLNLWRNLFNARQLLITCRFAEIIRRTLTQNVFHLSPLQNEMMGVYLTLILGKLINRNSRLSTWDRPGEKIVHACSNKLNAIQWDHTEINPFAPISGSLRYCFEDIIKSIQFARNCVQHPPISILNQDFLQTGFQPGVFDLIVTDPPFLDDAPYSEISDFFFVWYSRILAPLFPANPRFHVTQTPKDADFSVSHTRSKSHFQQKFIQMCDHLTVILKDRGLLILFFAHPDITAWTGVFQGILHANLHITATWPVITESKGLANTRKPRALLSSLILVGRKKDVSQKVSNQEAHPLDTEGFLQMFRTKGVQILQSRLQSSINSADYIIIAMGIALELISSIPQLSDNLSIPEILDLIQAISKEQLKMDGKV